MEIGRFSAVIGGDPSGLSTTLRASARQIETFAKQTQGAFKSIGTGDLGAVGTKAGRQIIDGIKREIGGNTNILRELTKGVDLANSADVGAVRALVEEHKRLAIAAGASADEMQQIAGILHLLRGREIGEAATRTKTLELNARAAQRELRGIGLAVRDMSRGAGGLDALSRRIGQFTEGTGFATTRTESLKRLRDVETSLKRALDSIQPTLTQRIQIERELARTSEAIRAATTGTVGAIGGSGAAARGAIGPVNSLTAALGRQVLVLFSLQTASRLLRASFTAADDQERAARKLLATSKITGEAFSLISGFATRAQTDLQVSSSVAADLVQNLVKLTSRAGETARTGDVLIRWMDLAAAQGLTLDEALQTIQTTLIGQDEGLNRLGLSNPQQIYERWAKGAQTSAAKMTDAQKAQAILNAVVESGTKVQGEYTRALNTAAGRQQAFKLELEQTAAAFGRSLQGSRDFATGAGSEILRLIRDIVGLNDAIERTRNSWLRIMGGALTGGASGFAREIAEAQAELDTAIAKAKKDRDAASRAFNQGPPRPRAAIAITGADETEGRKKEIELLKTLHGAEALRAKDIERTRQLLKDLDGVLRITNISQERRAELESQRSDLKGILDTSKAVSELRARVDALVVAYGLAADNAGRQQTIIPQLVAGYDRLNRLLAGQTNQASATSNELRAQLATLKAFDPVIVGLARRQFRGVENIPEIPKLRATAQIIDIEFGDVESRERLRLEADLVDIRLPTDVKNKAAKQLLNIRDLPPIPIDIDPNFDVASIDRAFGTAIAGLRSARDAFDLSEFIGDRKGMAEASTRAAVAEAALKREAAALVALFRDNPDLTKAQKDFGIAKVKEAVEGAARGTKQLGDGLRSVASTGRGLLSVADSLGDIGDEARRSLGGVIDLIDAVGAFKAAQSVAGGFGEFAAIAQALGAAVTIIASLVGTSPAAKQEAEAMRQTLRDNSEELSQLRSELRIANTPGAKTRAAQAFTDPRIVQGFTAVRGIIDLLTAIRVERPDFAALRKGLAAYGLTLDDVNRIAKEQGIVLFDSMGRIIPAAFDQFVEAMRLAAEQAVRFSKSFDDQTTAAALKRRVRGTETPADVFRDSIAVFKDVAPKLFADFFSGLDLGSKVGREEFRKRLIKFVDEFIAGTIPLEDFGGLDRETIIRAANAWLDSLDEMAEAAKEVAGQMINVAEGAFNLNKRLGQAIAIGFNAGLGTIPDIGPRQPSPVPLPATTTSATSVSVSIDLGGLVVGATGAKTGAERYAEIRRTALDRARMISPQAVDAVEAAFPPI